MFQKLDKISLAYSVRNLGLSR